MIILDANILLYAYDSASSAHVRAKEWVEEAFSGDETIGLPWQTIATFIRIITDTRISGNRFTTLECIDVVKDWIDHPNVRVLEQGDGYWHFLSLALVEGQIRGALVSDACLAATAMEHGGTLYSNDRDFTRFPGLRWVNPLA